MMERILCCGQPAEATKENAAFARQRQNHDQHFLSEDKLWSIERMLSRYWKIESHLISGFVGWFSGFHLSHGFD
jgi:hypothetical protein